MQSDLEKCELEKCELEKCELEKCELEKCELSFRAQRGISFFDARRAQQIPR